MMAQRLKRWESPRKPGRNDKGKGGSAKQRQRKKQFKVLQKRLKQTSAGRKNKSSDHKPNTQNGRESVLSRFCFKNNHEGQINRGKQSFVHEEYELSLKSQRLALYQQVA